MGIQDFFNTLFIIKRATFSKDENDNYSSSEEEVGQFMGHIQQSDAQLVQSLGMTFTKPFTIWSPSDSGVKEGDTLITYVGSYSVKAVQDYSDGSNRHLQIVAQLDKEVYNGS